MSRNLSLQNDKNDVNDLVHSSSAKPVSASIAASAREGLLLLVVIIVLISMWGPPA
ncbi:MAG: hypothetical protein KDD70_10825 [Bdellovibrionales bacterium]|nr:hypothetical protein [Bdellovibrionales bacterium]